MKKLIKYLLAVMCLITTACTTAQPTVEKDQTYAVWFSYLDMQNLNTSDEDTYRAEVEQVVQNLADTGIDLIYLHASAFTDAMYSSAIYPRSVIFEGTDYDPFAIFLETARKNHLSVEAWINPYRSVQVGDESRLADTNMIKTWIERNDERVRQVNSRWYLNPAYPEVQNLVVSVAEEILSRYQVDGLHIDDYFYPEGMKDNFDAYIFSQSSIESQTAFRQAQTESLIKQLSEVAHSHDIRFTVSCAGNNDNNLTMYYADVASWAQKGYIDVLIPQVYWGYEHPLKPYTETLQSFIDLVNGTDVQVMSGIAAYKVGTTDIYAGDGQDEWIISSDMLVRQSQTAKDLGCAGAAYFRYASLFAPSLETGGAVSAELFNLQAYINQ